MSNASFLLDLLLAGIVVWEVAHFLPRFRQLKVAVASGDAGARMRVYRRALAFEWITAVLALAALALAGRSLDPRALELRYSPLVHPFADGGARRSGLVVGMLIGLALGTLAFVVARLRARRRSPTATSAAGPSRWRRLLPDFTAMLPVTPRERLAWLAVAISAGICEEIVFRGWLLASLHGPVGLNGTRLILVAAVFFGLVHAYQGVPGIVLTAYAGMVLCVLYVATGSLLLPIVLHALVDARFALLPAERAHQPAVEASPPVARSIPNGLPPFRPATTRGEDDVLRLRT